MSGELKDFANIYGSSLLLFAPLFLYMSLRMKQSYCYFCIVFLLCVSLFYHFSLLQPPNTAISQHDIHPLLSYSPLSPKRTTAEALSWCKSTTSGRWLGSCPSERAAPSPGSLASTRGSTASSTGSGATLKSAWEVTAEKRTKEEEGIAEEKGVNLMKREEGIVVH